MTATATASSKTLREQATSIGMQMRELVESVAKEKNQVWSEEDSKRFDTMNGDYERLIGDAERIEKVERIESTREQLRDIDRRRDFRQNPKTGDDRPTYEEQDMALRAHLMGNRAPQRFRDAYEKCSIPKSTDKDSQGGYCVELMSIRGRAPSSLEEIRDHYAELVTRATTTAQTITTTGGGHTVQNELMREIEIALLEWGGMRESGAQVFRTETGATLPWPTVNDTTNKSVILAINTAADVEALVFGQQTMTAYKYTTQQVLVPMELMQDTSIALVPLIGSALGTRAGRGTNAHFTTGVTTDTQPQGVVTDSISGSTGSDVNAITYAELVTLEHSIDPAYRRSSAAGWMFNDSTLARLKRLVDGDSRPLWMPALSGISGGFPATMLGYRYTINQDMSSIASATTGTGGIKAILFGDFSKFKIRDVKQMEVLRSDERYIEKAQTVFIGFHRHDSKTIIASTATPPIKHFITKST